MLSNFSPSRIFLGAVLLLSLSRSHAFGEEATKVPDLTWNKCVTLAMDHNPDVQNARVEVENVEGQIIVKLSNFLPQVEAGTGNLPPTIGIGIGMPVYSAAFAPTVNAFPAARIAARANLRLALMEMVYRLRDAYIDAYYDQLLLPVAMKRVALLEDREKRSPSLFSAGKMSKADLESLRVRTTNAHFDVENAQNVLDSARLTLFQIIGLRPDDARLKGNLTTDFQSYVVKDYDQKKLVAMALEQRQDLKLLKELKKIDVAQLLVTQSYYYPTVLMGASFSSQFHPPHQLDSIYRILSPQTTQDQINGYHLDSTTSFSLGADFRIFDGGSLHGQLVQNRATLVQDDVKIREIEDQIPRQIALATDLAISTGKMLSDLTSTNLSDQTLKAVQQVFDAGRISQVEVLDAQDDAVSFEDFLLRLEDGHDQVLAALDRAAGKTLDIEGPLP